jgi:outer membrane protein
LFLRPLSRADVAFWSMLLAGSAPFASGEAAAQVYASVSPEQAPPVRTLAAAIALAYRNNPTLQATRYDLRGVDERIAQANAELRLKADVQVTAGYQWSYEGDISARNNFFTPTYSAASQSQATLSVQQPLYSGGHATATRRSAEASVSAAEERLRATEGDLLLSVVSTYMDVYRYQAERTIRAGSVQELEKLQREIEARQVAGELTRTDIAQARGQVAQAEAQLVQADQALRSARADFLAIVGAPADQVPAPPDLPGLPGDPDRAFQIAAQHSPELAYAQNTAQASRHDVEAAKANGRPSIALRGSAGINGRVRYPFRPADEDKVYSGSVVLTVPLLAGGQRASQVREASARNQADQLRIDAAQRELARVVTDTWNQIAAADQIGAISAKRRQAAATQLEGMLAEYRLGLRSTFDLLYAQQSLRDAEVAQLDAAREQYVSRATLLRRIGTLQADDISDNVPLYDPKIARAAAERANGLPIDDVVRAIDADGSPEARVPAPVAPPPSDAPALKPGASPRPVAPIDGPFRKPLP